jgi:DNA-binding SARP family transcriptional activator
MGLEFRLLGPLEVFDGPRRVPVPQPRQRALLAALLLHARQVVPADQLLERVWERDRPANARATLHTAVNRLRRRLGPDLIETRWPGYLIAVERDQVDTTRFLAMVDQAERAGDPEHAARVLTEALALWRGPALADVDADLLRRDLLVELTERNQQAVELLVDARLRLGQHAALVPELRLLTERFPTRERLWAQLMTALFLCDRRAEALETYRAARDRFVELLGLEPGEQLRAIERAILAGELLPPAGAAGWRRPRQLPLDPPVFAGRSELVADLAERLTTRRDTTPVVAVYGGPGVGKSALAVRVAHRVAVTFPDGQFHVRLGSGVETAEVLGELLNASGASASAPGLAAAWRSHSAGRRFLLVIDDAWSAEQVEQLLPGGPGSAVIVTSRIDLRGLAVSHGAWAVALDVLSSAEARELLARVLGEKRVVAEEAAVAELVRLCVRLPLALRIAAANVAQYGSVAELVAVLRTNLLDRLAVAGDPRAAVRVAFDQSYSRLDDEDARLFRLLGCAPVDVTAEFAAGMLGEPVGLASSRLETLAGVGLLQRHRPARYRLHELLRRYARVAPRPAGEPPITCQQPIVTTLEVT